MFPEIIRIGNFGIHTYGLFIAIGIIIALFLTRKECERVNLNGELIVDTLFWAIWIGIIGSRIFYVLYFPEEFIKDPFEFFRIWKGGLVFHGGILVAVPFTLILFKRKNIPILRAVDAVVIFVPLAHFFGRLGCFSAGCCYGRICELPWAVKFNHSLSLAPKNIPIHPTQLYEALLNLILFFVLFTTRKKITKEGLKLGVYLTGYGIIRFFVEFFRGDPRNIYYGFSVAQLISAGFFIAGIIIIFLISLKKDINKF